MTKLVTKGGAEVQIIPKQASQAVRVFDGKPVNEQTHVLALVNGGIQVVAKRNLKEV